MSHNINNAHKALETGTGGTTSPQASDGYNPNGAASGNAKSPLSNLRNILGAAIVACFPYANRRNSVFAAKRVVNSDLNHSVEICYMEPIDLSDDAPMPPPVIVEERGRYRRITWEIIAHAYQSAERAFHLLLGGLKEVRRLAYQVPLRLNHSRDFVVERLSDLAPRETVLLGVELLQHLSPLIGASGTIVVAATLLRWRASRLISRRSLTGSAASFATRAAMESSLLLILLGVFYIAYQVFCGGLVLLANTARRLFRHLSAMARTASVPEDVKNAEADDLLRQMSFDGSWTVVVGAPSSYVDPNYTVDDRFVYSESSTRVKAPRYDYPGPRFYADGWWNLIIPVTREYAVSRHPIRPGFEQWMFTQEQVHFINRPAATSWSTVAPLNGPVAVLYTSSHVVLHVPGNVGETVFPRDAVDACLNTVASMSGPIFAEIYGRALSFYLETEVPKEDVALLAIAHKSNPGLPFRAVKLPDAPLADREDSAFSPITSPFSPGTPINEVQYSYHVQGAEPTEDMKPLGSAPGPVFDQPVCVLMNSEGARLATAEVRQAAPQRATHNAPMQVSLRYEGYEDEFVAMLVDTTGGNVKPWGKEEVYAAQDTPKKKAQVLKAMETAELPKEVFYGAFEKTEPGKLDGAGRLIGQFPDHGKTEWATFVLPMALLMGQFLWYAFGRTNAESAAAVAAVASLVSYFMLETDMSKFDATIGEAFRRFEAKVLKGLIHPAHLAEALRIHEKWYEAPGSFKDGIKLPSCPARKSGEMATSFFNTLINALVAYIVYREMGFDRDEAWHALGLYGGDDGISRDAEPDTYVAVCSHYGLVVKPKILKAYAGPQRKPLHTPGLSMLGRVYGPHVWSGSTDSMHDPVRSFNKIGYSVKSKPTEMEVRQHAVDRATATLVTDPGTPVISEWARAVMSWYPNSEAVPDWNVAHGGQYPSAPWESDNGYWKLRLTEELHPDCNVRGLIAWLKKSGSGKKPRGMNPVFDLPSFTTAKLEVPTSLPPGIEVTVPSQGIRVKGPPPGKDFLRLPNGKKVTTAHQRAKAQKARAKSGARKD